jgi:hypothetical protein
LLLKMAPRTWSAAGLISRNVTLLRRAAEMRARTSEARIVADHLLWVCRENATQRRRRTTASPPKAAR